MTIGTACVLLFMVLGGAKALDSLVAAALVIFAVASLIATLILRRVIEPPLCQVKTFASDIND